MKKAAEIMILNRKLVYNLIVLEEIRLILIRFNNVIGLIARSMLRVACECLFLGK